MEGDSRGHPNAYVGYAQIVPKNNHGGKQTTSYNYQARQGKHAGLYQRTSKASSVDKQTAKYARVTNKEVFSGGDTFKERSTGRVGFKDEYKTTSTYRVGDKNSYSEYQLEERFRRINFGDSGNSNNNNGNYGGGSRQNYGGRNKSNYGSVLHKTHGSSSENNNGNHHGGVYKNYGGSSKCNCNKYGGSSINNNGNCGRGWYKNYGGISSSNNSDCKSISDENGRSSNCNGNYNAGSYNNGGEAALRSYSSFQGEAASKGYSSFQGSHYAEYEDSGVDEEEFEDYTDVWNSDLCDDTEEYEEW